MRRARAPPGATTAGDGGATHQPYNLIVPRSACPNCRAPISALAEHPGAELAAAGRPLRQLPHPHQRALPAGRAAERAARRRRGVEVRPRLAARPPRMAVTWCLIALTVIDLDHQLLPDSTDAAAAVGRARGFARLARVQPGEPAGQPGRFDHRRGCRLPQPLGRVPRLPPADGEGRHGLRRLQAARRPRRLARLAHAAAHRALFGRRRRGGRHRADRRRAAATAACRCRSARSSRPLAGWR